MKLKKLFIFLIVILFPNLLISQSIIDIKNKIESIIYNYYNGLNVIVKVVGPEFNKDGKSISIRKLAVKVDNLIIGNLISDNLTVIYDYVTIDVNKLLKQSKLKIISYNNVKANILVSTQNFENTIQRKLRSLGKQNIKAIIQFNSPWIECRYNVPKAQLSSDTKSMIFKYLIGNTLEGYVAFRISVRKALIYVRAEKLILNHFLIPQSLVNTFESIYNPFDDIPTIQPFGIKINNITIQNNYILFSS